MKRGPHDSPASGSAPSLFVHIGAGEGDALDIATRADHAVLIEPDPERCQILKAEAASLKNVRVECAALAENAGDQAFFIQSLPRFNSSRAITGATELFRGLRCVEKLTVRGITLSELIDSTKVDGRVSIRIDAVSEALLALKQLKDLGFLRRAVQIQVKVSDAELHEGGACLGDVVGWAQENKCRIVLADKSIYRGVWYADVSLLPASARLAKRSSKTSTRFERACVNLGAHVQELESECDELFEELQHRNGEIKNQRLQLARREKRVEKVTAERDAALERSQALEASVSEREAERDAALERSQALEASVSEREAERDAALERSQALEASVSEREAERDAALERSQALEASVSEREAERDAALERSQALEASVSEREAERDAAVKTIDALNSEAAAKQKDIDKAKEAEELAREELALALRTQNMAQASLEDLRKKFEGLNREKENLDKLLGNLMARLYDASGRAEALSWADAQSKHVKSNSSRDAE